MGLTALQEMLWRWNKMKGVQGLLPECPAMAGAGPVHVCFLLCITASSLYHVHFWCSQRMLDCMLLRSTLLLSSTYIYNAQPIGNLVIEVGKCDVADQEAEFPCEFADPYSQQECSETTHLHGWRWCPHVQGWKP